MYRSRRSARFGRSFHIDEVAVVRDFCGDLLFAIFFKPKVNPEG